MSSDFDDEIDEILNDLDDESDRDSARKHLKALKRQLQNYNEEVSKTEDKLSEAESDAESANERAELLEARIDDILDVLDVEYGVPRSELTTKPIKAAFAFPMSAAFFKEPSSKPKSMSSLAPSTNTQAVATRTTASITTSESLKSIARTPKADACRNEHPCALVHTI